MSEEMKKRCDQLFKMGLKYNGQEYFLDDINVHWTEMTCDSAQEWDSKMLKIKEEIARREKV